MLIYRWINHPTMTKISIWIIVLLVAIINAGAWFGVGSRVQPPEYMTITDDLGREVNISKPPERIISIAPSMTEMLFAIGLENKVIGVTEYCDYPPEALSKEKIGTYTIPNIEKILLLEPDLILATGAIQAQREVVKLLEGYGLTVVALNPGTIEEIFKSIRLLGQITGQEEVALQLVSDLENRVESITKITENIPRAQRPLVHYEVGEWRTIGPGTFGHTVIELAGGINIGENCLGSYPTISSEFVIVSDPDVIILPTEMGSMVRVTPEEVKARPGWEIISAVGSNRIYPIERSIMARSGPRLVEALELMTRYLHPNFFRW